MKTAEKRSGSHEEPGTVHDRSIRQLAAMLSEGELSARALLDHCLERIDRLNSKLNAFVFIDPGVARAADAADQRLRAGHPLSVLDGIPVGVKDNLLVRGQPAVWGSRFLADYVPYHDELPVAMLREAGAVLLGKTNVSEFTLRGQTSNPVFGTTRNPWDENLTPGGSSGGSVAAVAAGMIPIALCTDGGGSIRRPAAHTGLVGLKASVGRIPRADGFPAILLDCEVVGPVARSVDDVRAFLSVVGRSHPRDNRSRCFAPYVDAVSEPKRCRILYVERFGDAPVDPVIVASCRRAVDRLKAFGHDVSTGPLPFAIDAAAPAWGKICEVGLALLAGRDNRFFDLASQAYVEQAVAGGALSAVEYLEIIETLNALRTAVGEAFGKFDVIVTPTTAAQPWPAEEVYPPLIDGKDAGPRGHAVYTGWVNLCGHPAISIPVDPAPDGMPIGLQLVGDFAADALLLDLASQYERAFPWTERWPAMARS